MDHTRTLSAKLRAQQLRAARKAWETPPEPPVASLTASLIDRDAPRRLPVWRL
jgi:hypothetical protein